MDYSVLHDPLSDLCIWKDAVAIELVFGTARVHCRKEVHLVGMSLPDSPSVAVIGPLNRNAAFRILLLERNTFISTSNIIFVT